MRIEDCNVRRGIRTAIVTGASRGIGKAIVKELARDSRAPYDLAMISRNLEELEETIREITKDIYYRYYGRCFVPFKCDVGNPEDVKRTFEEIYRKFGSIDVLVNNAGVNSRRTLNGENLENLTNFERDLEGWNIEIATNLTGTYICSYVASGYMIKKGKGNIINISSIKGIEPTTSPGYGSSKAGIIKLTKDFAKALATHNIRVNCIVPGFIDTGMTSELPEEKKQAYRKMIPQKRFGTPEEIAKVVGFLASEDSSYITGAKIDVNGGYLM